MKWQKIETAPKDETNILGYGPVGYESTNPVCFVTFWREWAKEWYHDSDMENNRGYPTHWMPLPEPPDES